MGDADADTEALALGLGFGGNKALSAVWAATNFAVATLSASVLVCFTSRAAFNGTCA